jgi:16S rRNA (cytidine1402-2'-O)-methyltransferase
LLTHSGIPAAGRLRAVHAHNEREGAEWVVRAIADGARVAYATDAGMPGISDPGAHLVRACIDAGLPVEVVPGPSAVLTALVLSGFPTDRFVFEGFLPRKGRTRAERLASIATETRTVVVFEAPGRIAATLSDLASVCGGERLVCVAREITKLHEEVWEGPVALAAGLARAAEPRGEHVIVVSGIPLVVEPASDAAVEDAVRDALVRGLSARDTAAEVATALGVPKRRAYELAVTLRKQ